MKSKLIFKKMVVAALLMCSTLIFAQQGASVNAVLNNALNGTNPNQWLVESSPLSFRIYNKLANKYLTAVDINGIWEIQLQPKDNGVTAINQLWTISRHSWYYPDFQLANKGVGASALNYIMLSELTSGGGAISASLVQDFPRGGALIHLDDGSVGFPSEGTYYALNQKSWYPRAMVANDALTTVISQENSLISDPLQWKFEYVTDVNIGYKNGMVRIKNSVNNMYLTTDITSATNSISLQNINQNPKLLNQYFDVITWFRLDESIGDIVATDFYNTFSCEGLNAGGFSKSAIGFDYTATDNKLPLAIYGDLNGGTISKFNVNGATVPLAMNTLCSITCDWYDRTIVAEVATTSLTNVNHSEITLKQNRGIVYLYANNQKIKRATVVNIQGVTVFESANVSNDIDLRGLPKGIYIINLKTETKNLQQKIVLD